MSVQAAVTMPSTPPACPEVPCPRLVVEVGTRFIPGGSRPDHLNPGWRSYPEVIVEDVHLRTGPHPSTCTILVPRSLIRAERFWVGAAAGAERGPEVFPPVPEGSYPGDPGRAFYLGAAPPPATGGSSPDHFQRYGLLRVRIENVSPQGGNYGVFGALAAAGLQATLAVGCAELSPSRVLFLGNVISWTWDLTHENLRLHCQDFRWRLQRMHVYGIEYAYPAATTWGLSEIREHLADFNAEGLPDRFLGVDTDTLVEQGVKRFGPPNLNAGMTWRGAWRDGPYVVGDGVAYEGHFFICIAEDEDESAPGGTEFWREIATPSHCAFWTVGDALEYLRLHFSDLAARGTTKGYLSYDGPTDEDIFLAWPEVSSGSLPGLFAAADPGDPEEPAVPNEALQMDVAGMSLADAIASLLRRAAQTVAGRLGAHDWTLDPVQGTGAPSDPALAEIVVYNVASPPQGSRDLYLPEYGESVLALPHRDIVGGSLTLEGGDYRNRILALGGRKKIQSTFLLSPASTEEERAAYLAALEAWRAAGEPTPDEGPPYKPDDKIFPGPYLEYALPRDFDFEGATFDGGGFFDPQVGIGDGEFLPSEARPFEKRLVSERNDIEGQEDVRAKMNVILWRSVNAGTTWERLPSGIQVTLHPDRAVLRLAPAARGEGQGGVDDDLIWTYDPDEGYGTPYPILATIAVPADDRLAVLDDAPAAELPLETVHDATSEYGYEAISRSRSIDFTTDPPEEIAEGVLPWDPEHPITTGPVKIKDDTPRLAAVVRRHAADIGGFPVHGDVELSGLAQRFPLGCKIHAIVTSKSVDFGAAGRGPYFLDAAVRELLWEFGTTWRTTLTLERLSS